MVAGAIEERGTDPTGAPARGARRREAVYDAIRADIVAGGWQPGERVTEQSAAARYDVSRTPVREALSQLARDGLLEERARGYAVPELGAEDVEGIYEMRLLLEPRIARHAAERATHDEILALHAALEAERAQQTAQDLGVFVAANLQFRDALFAPCPNPRLVSGASIFTDQIRLVMNMTLHPLENRETTCRYHALAYEAIKTGDGDRAVSAITELLFSARDYFRRAMAAATSEAR